MVTWNHGRKGILGNVAPPLWSGELAKSNDDAELSMANVRHFTTHKIGTWEAFEYEDQCGKKGTEFRVK